MANESSSETKTPEPTKPTETEKLKGQILKLRNLVIQLANERDLAIGTLQKMSMDLKSVTDVDKALKEI